VSVGNSSEPVAFDPVSGQNSTNVAKCHPVANDLATSTRLIDITCLPSSPFAICNNRFLDDLLFIHPATLTFFNAPPGASMLLGDVSFGGCRSRVRSLAQPVAVIATIE
jgi:hypothetical protein